MIDLNILREKPEHILGLLHLKDPHFDGKKLYELDQDVRALRMEVEQLRHKKNELADRAKSGVTDELRAQSIQVGKDLKQKESDLATQEEAFKLLYLSCPNVPQEDLPVGGKEANKVVSEIGVKPTFSFQPKNHLELATKLGWLDFEAAGVITGSNFALYKGDAVRMLYSLTMMMLKNNMRHGYEPVLPPYLVNEQSLVVSSTFPKFRDQVYEVPEDGLFLVPTAEVPLANLYRNKILTVDQLPIRMTSWTSCFRREAGGYGSTERGLIRIHEFEKVELFSLCEPSNSNQELDKMLACAEDLLKQLGLHYRVSLLAGQDCSFASSRTYDIEVWMPGQNAYYEVSSVSNCTDFQSRRGMIRYKALSGGKTEFVHTLNGSSLALPRLMVALLETYQQEDGSVQIPEIIKKEGLFI